MKMLSNRILLRRCLNELGRRYVRTRPQDPEEIRQMDRYEFSKTNVSRKGAQKQLFCWGFSATGALGDPKFLPVDGGNDAISPRKVLRVKPRRMTFANSKSFHIYDACAGFGFTVIAATYSGTRYVLFGCGLNTDSQIGYQATEHSGEPLVCVGNLVPIAIPDLEQEQQSGERERIIKVACGRAHTVCLSSRGNVFTLGNNSFGQCGRPIVKDEKYFASKRLPYKVPVPKEDPVIDIICGLDNTFLLTKSGTVYSFGWGNDGQLGQGGYETRYRPAPVIGDIQNERIVAISSAGDTVLALNDRGQVFGWGNNEYGQLLSTTNDPRPQVDVARHFDQLESMIGSPALDVAAAGSMCSVLNKNGEVFVWGYGILGLGPEIRETSRPTQLSPNLFGRSTLNSRIKVTSITAGLYHFGAINDRGELFTWGRNNRANLGTGNKNDMTFPFRVSLPNHVTKVSLGIDHTIAIARKLM